MGDEWGSVTGPHRPESTFAFLTAVSVQMQCLVQTDGGARASGQPEVKQCLHLPQAYRSTDKPPEQSPLTPTGTSKAARPLAHPQSARSPSERLPGSPSRCRPAASPPQSSVIKGPQRPRPLLLSDFQLVTSFLLSPSSV